MSRGSGWLAVVAAIVLALLLSLSLHTDAQVTPGVAQFQGTVVTTCGTLPQPYAPGSTRLPAIDINGNLCSSGASLPAGQIPGTATNDNAAAGNVGEFIESSIALNTTQSLSTGVPLNVTSINLTAGDWDVQGTVVFKCAATTTVNNLTSGLSDVSATLETAPVSRSATVIYSASTIFSVVGNTFIPVGPVRWSLAATTPIYLIASSNFGTSTCQTNGGDISARRRR